MNIYLIRHTEVYNPNKLCYGQSEIPLAENFTASFDWLQEVLQADIALNSQVFSSPFRRCTKLADYLSNGNFITDERIAELNFGDWEMQPWNNINANDLNNWMTDFVNYKVPNGENFVDLYERSVAFFEDIIKSDKENLFIISHAGVIRSLLAYILDFPLEKAFNLEIDYSSITKINYNKEYKTSKIGVINLTQQLIKTNKIRD